MISVNFAKSVKFRTVGVSPHWRQVRLTPGSLLLTGSCPEYPGQAPKGALFLWRRTGACPGVIVVGPL